MNKRGGFTDLFLFMIIAFVLIFTTGIMIYISSQTNQVLNEKMGDMDFGEKTGGQIINESMGVLDQSYQSLYWISTFLIVGMILSIFIGSYLVTTRPIFFIPYLFIVIIAVVVSVPISNSYVQLIENEEIAPTFAGFTSSNYIMFYLPVWIVVIGFIGGIIMFISLGRRNEFSQGGYYEG